LLKELILGNNPRHKPITDKQVHNWAREADLMITRDGRTEQEIESLILWTQADSFEHKNVLSMGKLRERFDHLTLKAAKVTATKRHPKPIESMDHSKGLERLTARSQVTSQ